MPQKNFVSAFLLVFMLALSVKAQDKIELQETNDFNELPVRITYVRIEQTGFVNRPTINLEGPRFSASVVIDDIPQIFASLACNPCKAGDKIPLSTGGSGQAYGTATYQGRSLGMTLYVALNFTAPDVTVKGIRGRNINFSLPAKINLRIGFFRGSVLSGQLAFVVNEVLDGKINYNAYPCPNCSPFYPLLKWKYFRFQSLVYEFALSDVN